MISIGWISWSHCIVQLIDIDSIVTSLIYDWNNVTEFKDLNVVCSEHIFKLLSWDSSLIFVVEKTEALLHVECLVTE